MVYNILDYGAVADGRTINTQAINRAIEACAADGGGRVLVPAGGVFVSGTIWLKSHVELHLEHGAVLRASGDFADYNAEDAYPQNYGCLPEEWTGTHFILAVECEDIAITGTGTIDGNAGAFVSDQDQQPQIPDPYTWFLGCVRAMRPGQNVCLVECRQVRIEGITMRELPSWALFLFGCEYVNIHGIRVFNLPDRCNTDGIDIDACRYVTVSDCLIDTGDDAIAIRSSAYRLKDKSRLCEFVTVSNCELASSSSVFRIGVGRNDIRHVRVSDIVAHRGAALITFSIEYGEVSRTPVRDFNFCNVSGANISYPITMVGRRGVPIEHITLENVRCEARAGMKLMTEVPGCFKDVTVRNFDIFLQEEPAKLTERDLARRGEYAVDCQGIEGLRMERVRVFAPDCVREKWNGMIRVQDCPGAELVVFTFGKSRSAWILPRSPADDRFRRLMTGCRSS